MNSLKWWYPTPISKCSKLVLRPVFKVSNPDTGRRTNFENFEIGVAYHHFKSFQSCTPARGRTRNFEKLVNNEVPPPCSKSSFSFLPLGAASPLPRHGRGDALRTGWGQLGALRQPKVVFLRPKGVRQGVGQAFFHVSALWGGSEAQFSLRCIGCCAAGRVIGHRLLCSVGTRAEGPTLKTLKLAWVPPF